MFFNATAQLNHYICVGESHPDLDSCQMWWNKINFFRVVKTQESRDSQARVCGPVTAPLLHETPGHSHKSLAFEATPVIRKWKIFKWILGRFEVNLPNPQSSSAAIRNQPSGLSAFENNQSRSSACVDAALAFSRLKKNLQRLIYQNRLSLWCCCLGGIKCMCEWWVSSQAFDISSFFFFGR